MSKTGRPANRSGRCWGNQWFYASLFSASRKTTAKPIARNRNGEYHRKPDKIKRPQKEAAQKEDLWRNRLSPAMLAGFMFNFTQAPGNWSRRVICLCACLLWAVAAQAHQTSESYLNLSVEGTNITGTLDVSLIDLEHVVKLDADGDGKITYDELKARQTDVDAYVLKHLYIRCDRETNTIRITDHQVASHSDGIYDVIEFVIDTAQEPRKVQVDYRLLIDVNPLQRGLMQLNYGGKSRIAVFTADNASQSFTLSEAPPVEQVREFVGEGTAHIWQGYDHALFLLSLLLPAVLFYSNGHWQPVPGLRPAILAVLKIVTAFTVAHTITLTLAALGWVRLPPRWIEVAIDASLIFAALNNLRPVVEKNWAIAFGFGLIHGFSFANALTDIGLASGKLAVPLLSFNLGVELGQLTMVAAFLPIAYLLRQTHFYQRTVFRCGSILIIAIAAWWMSESLFGLKLLSR